MTRRPRKGSALLEGVFGRDLGGFNTLYSVHSNEGMYNTCTPCIGQYISTVQALGHLVGQAAAECERAGGTLHGGEPEGPDAKSSSCCPFILFASQPSKQDPRHPQQKGKRQVCYINRLPTRSLAPKGREKTGQCLAACQHVAAYDGCMKGCLNGGHGRLIRPSMRSSPTRRRCTCVTVPTKTKTKKKEKKNDASSL